jgi:peptidoglycan hydrolase CwlO-like protein
MYNTIFYLVLIFFLLYFTFHYSLVENLTVNDIAAKKKDNCGCDEVKSLSNLVSQYNILNDKITKINKEIQSLQDVKSTANSNKKSIDKLNASIKKFSELMSKK